MNSNDDVFKRRKITPGLNHKTAQLYKDDKVVKRSRQEKQNATKSDASQYTAKRFSRYVPQEDFFKAELGNTQLQSVSNNRTPKDRDIENHGRKSVNLNYANPIMPTL